MDDVESVSEETCFVRGRWQERRFRSVPREMFRTKDNQGMGSSLCICRGAYLSKCFFPVLYVNRGCSYASITFSHLLGSLNTSSSGSSSTANPPIPILVWLSSRKSDEGRNPSRVFVLSASCDGSNIKLFWRVNPRPPLIIFPPLMLPSKFFKISLSSALVPSSMTPPLRFFHDLATSSSTFSASPSSRHPDPQCRPIKVASSCSAEEVSVRLCFLVKVRNARGRNVAGGRRMGRMAAFDGADTLKGLSGWTGVPKAGEEEGIEDEGMLAARFLGAKNGVAGGLDLLDVLSGLPWASFRLFF